MKRLAPARRPAVAQQKHFWLARMVALIDLGRDVEESFGSKRAHHHHRPFDEAGDLLEQAFVLDELEALREGEVAGIVHG